MNSYEMASLAIETLDENKAIDIQRIDVTPLTSMTDFMVICTATSTRHAASLVERVKRKLRESGIHSLGTEGAEENDAWVLVDFGSIIVHVFLAEARALYSLEKLWTLTQASRNKTNHEN